MQHSKFNTEDDKTRGRWQTGKVRKGQSSNPDTRTNKISELVHELEVHEAWLQIQNEELGRVQEELQRLYECYRNAYDHAPIGYIILRASDNTILDANLTATGFLRLERSEIIETKFTRYIAPEFMDDFSLHYKRALESNKESCEVMMRRGDSSSLWVLLEIAVLEGRQLLYVIMLDITQRKELDVQLEEYRHQLEIRVEEGIRKNRDLALQFLFVQEKEREKLGLELHDNVGQLLTLMVMSINRLRKLPPQEIRKELDEIETQAGETIKQVRDISHVLSTYMLEEMGLSQALESYFQQVQDRTGLRINFRHELQSRLPRVMEITLFRIIQEAITNVVRHARTDEVDVSMNMGNEMVNLRIEDKGAGFTPASVGSTYMGVTGMQERAALLGARLTVDSSVGRGTQIIGEFPLP